jgi:predicted dehydrogenase
MPISRRSFLTALPASSYSRLRGANDRIQVGFIGYGLIGAQHVYTFHNQKDVDCVALCDVYAPRMEQGVAACGGKAKGYSDFRRMLDSKDLQAVVVATPDHWHALMTMMACAAGKDVYVEKPMTLFVREGRWMTQVARKHKRVVQVGVQQRSGRHYGAARELLRSGAIGKIHSVRMGSFRNILPGFGKPPDGAAPGELDYEMWLGPAPKRPYNPHRALYHFRWFWDYSGGQMTNLAAHSIDIVHWAMGVAGPNAVTSAGGRFAMEDDGETPDTQDTLFEFPGFTAVYSLREASGGAPSDGGLRFYGTKGGMSVSRGGFEIAPDVETAPENSIPVFQGHPVGGPQRREIAPKPRTEARREKGSGQEQFDLHARNFLDCIRTRQRTVADVEDGHQVSVSCHLGNISLRTGRKLRWDVKKEEIIGDAEASKMLVREYRAPWEKVLRSLLA